MRLQREQLETLLSALLQLESGTWDSARLSAIDGARRPLERELQRIKEATRKDR